MARSTYIYLVTDCFDRPLASFTVKHELIFWLKRHGIYKIYKDPLTLYRIKDNPQGVADEGYITLDIDELLEKEK